MLCGFESSEDMSNGSDFAVKYNRDHRDIEEASIRVETGINERE